MGKRPRKKSLPLAPPAGARRQAKRRRRFVWASALLTGFLLGFAVIAVATAFLFRNWAESQALWSELGAAHGFEIVAPNAKLMFWPPTLSVEELEVSESGAPLFRASGVMLSLDLAAAATWALELDISAHTLELAPRKTQADDSGPRTRLKKQASAPSNASTPASFPFRKLAIRFQAKRASLPLKSLPTTPLELAIEATAGEGTRRIEGKVTELSFLGLKATGAFWHDARADGRFELEFREGESLAVGKIGGKLGERVIETGVEGELRFSGHEIQVAAPTRLLVLGEVLELGGRVGLTGSCRLARKYGDWLINGQWSVDLRGAYLLFDGREKAAGEPGQLQGSFDSSAEGFRLESLDTELQNSLKILFKR